MIIHREKLVKTQHIDGKVPHKCWFLKSKTDTYTCDEDDGDALMLMLMTTATDTRIQSRAHSIHEAKHLAIK